MCRILEIIFRLFFAILKYVSSNQIKFAVKLKKNFNMNIYLTILSIFWSQKHCQLIFVSNYLIKENQYFEKVFAQVSFLLNSKLIYFNIIEAFNFEMHNMHSKTKTGWIRNDCRFQFQFDFIFRASLLEHRLSVTWHYAILWTIFCIRNQHLYNCIAGRWPYKTVWILFHVFAPLYFTECSKKNNVQIAFLFLTWNLSCLIKSLAGGGYKRKVKVFKGKPFLFEIICNIFSCKISVYYHWLFCEKKF